MLLTWDREMLQMSAGRNEFTQLNEEMKAWAQIPFRLRPISTSTSSWFPSSAKSFPQMSRTVCIKCPLSCQTRQARETTAEFHWTGKGFQSESHTDSVEPKRLSGNRRVAFFFFGGIESMILVTLHSISSTSKVAFLSQDQIKTLRYDSFHTIYNLHIDCASVNAIFSNEGHFQGDLFSLKGDYPSVNTHSLKITGWPF